VFQYLGFIDQPAQIAFTGFDGQVAYDFRRGKARVNGSVWRRPEDLTADESHRWLELIRLWERMVIARARAREASLPR
jgi:hypothetical protein